MDISTYHTIFNSYKFFHTLSLYQSFFHEGYVVHLMDNHKVERWRYEQRTPENTYKWSTASIDNWSIQVRSGWTDSEVSPDGDGEDCVIILCNHSIYDQVKEAIVSLIGEPGEEDGDEPGSRYAHW